MVKKIKDEYYLNGRKRSRIFCRLTTQNGVTPAGAGIGAFSYENKKGERKRFLVSAYKTKSSKSVG